MESSHTREVLSWMRLTGLCTLSAKCWMMKDVFDILGFSNKEFLLTKLLYSFWSQFSSVPWGNWKRRQRQVLVKKRDEKWLAGGKRQMGGGFLLPQGAPPRQRPFFLWAALSIHLPLTLIFIDIYLLLSCYFMTSCGRFIIYFNKLNHWKWWKNWVCQVN